MSKYAKTKDVKITMPLALYEEILEVLKEENMWSYPQSYIIEAVKEKIERWKKEHGNG
jgi:hypothetical protein